jgi:hypothetical protein
MTIADAEAIAEAVQPRGHVASILMAISFAAAVAMIVASDQIRGYQAGMSVQADIR